MPHKMRANPPPPGTAGSRTARTNAAMSTSWAGTAAATRSGGAAALTTAATPVIMAVMAMSLDGVSPAHRERKHVSAYACAPMAPRAGTRTCERARAGAPSRASSLLPWRMAAHWSQWAPSPERGGAGFEVAVVATSVASEAQTASRLRHRWKWHRLRAHTYSLIRQTRAQTRPYPATITGMCGARTEVLESKRGSPGSLNHRGARAARQLQHLRWQSPLPLSRPNMGTSVG